MSINVNKLFTFVLAELLLPVYFFIHFFILMLLLYFCLLVDQVNKPIIFFLQLLFLILYNTISIFVTIFRVISKCLLQMAEKVHSFQALVIITAYIPCAIVMQCVKCLFNVAIDGNNDAVGVEVAVV